MSYIQVIPWLSLVFVLNQENLCAKLKVILETNH